MPERIGLEAVLGMANFNRGMKQYTSGINTMTKQTSTAATGLKSFDDKLGGLSGGLTSLIPGVVGATAAFYGLSQVMEFGKEGAVVAQTKDSFDRLMRSMGAAPNILQQMRDATLNTVDDMTLMNGTMTMLAGASNELGQAMVGAAPKLLEISKAAVKLKPSLGDVSHVYESLALGIKRNSPMLIDNANIMVKVGAANESYAAKIGRRLTN